LATAKKAICIPSRRPTTLMRMKKTMTAAHSGTPSHMVVLPSNRPAKVTAKENPRMASDPRQRRKKKLWARFLIGFNCLTGKLRHEHLDEVRRMQQAGELDRIRNPVKTAK
jgi:hypothetical protein